MCATVHRQVLHGSHAGAMNAVAFAHGWMLVGRDGARQGLADFWTEVGRQIDFERLRHSSPFKLFIAATQANTCKLRIFRKSELTVDMLLASACLPKIHHPVLIDGEPYWDGGYSANPAVFPLFYDCQTSDVLLVLLSPLKHADTPHSVQEIEARIAELSFSAHFMREMNMFAQAKAYARSSWLTWGWLERRLQSMRFHMVDSSQLPLLERGETRMLAHGPFLELLKEQGQQRARQWLTSHGAVVGQASSIDLVQLFG